MSGARCACMAFHCCMSPSPSGSWATATQTGPPTDFIFVARSFAQASPLPAAMSFQEYGAEKLIHGTRWFVASAVAVLTAELTEPEPQKVRWTPSFLPIADSHGFTSALPPYAPPMKAPQLGMPRAFT